MMKIKIDYGDGSIEREFAFAGSSLLGRTS